MWQGHSALLGSLGHSKQEKAGQSKDNQKSTVGQAMNLNKPYFKTSSHTLTTTLQKEHTSLFYSLNVQDIDLI